jgi:hypothetical protein
MILKNIKYLLLLILISCSSSKVVYDYDKKVDFNQYKTYHIFENAGEGLNKFDQDRILSSIDKEMIALGFTKQDNPDFFIDFKSSKKENQNRNTIGIGLGSGGINSSIGVSGGIPIDNKKYLEQITIDFVTNKSQQLFWQGILESKISEKSSPEKREHYFDEVVKKILVCYPPKK